MFLHKEKKKKKLVEDFCRKEVLSNKGDYKQGEKTAFRMGEHNSK